MSEAVPGQDPYTAVLADLRRRRNELEDAIRVLEAVRGSSQPLTTEKSQAPAPALEHRGQFAGMSIGDASRQVLAQQRKTLQSAQIAHLLASGGLSMTSADPANVVSSVLARRFQSVGDIVKVSRGVWGLAEWYPNKNFHRDTEKPVGVLVSGPETDDEDDEASSLRALEAAEDATATDPLY